MKSLGLIVAGDFALATGADQHVGFVARTLAGSGVALAWAWLLPADRAQLAAAFHEAWQRPQTVACFGGLGEGSDDIVRSTVDALQLGRTQVGLPGHDLRTTEGVTQVGNLVLFPGAPALAHPLFQQWWARQITSTVAAADASEARESLRWQLPETARATAARRTLKQQFPLIAQRIDSHAGGGVCLTLSGPSKGKVQQARKALQQRLAEGNP